jgi:hydroxymethylpyrimidine/phosphomethylpyrimidine kinase
MIRSLRQRETSGRSRPGSKSVPVVLTIAGSDNSGGAGIQADLKTFTALGVYGTSAVTCVVAEHPGRVLNITPVPAARVADQVRLVLEAFPVAAIKTGMLYSAEIIAAVAKAIRPALVKPEAIRALRKFIAQATVVTPNRDEAALLWGAAIGDLKALDEAARALAKALGGPAVLAKGGHLKTGMAVDVLVTAEGKLRRFAVKRIPGVDPHGTGCTYSAAIAAGLARGLSLEEAVAAGKRFITQAIRRRFEMGGYQLLNHFPA